MPPAKKKTAAKKKTKKKKAKKKASTASAAKAKPARKKAKKNGRSTAKRKAALSIIVPTSTSTRMAGKAAAAVWAISSEKTQEMIVSSAKEFAVEEILADPFSPALEADLRRCSRDGYGFFRAELGRPEDDPSDPHTGWRMVNKRLRHEMLPPTPLAIMQDLEARLGLELAPSYWDFSLEWGGGQLYVQETGGYKIVPARELIAEVRGPLCNMMLQPFLPVVDLGCGDYLAMNTSKSNRAKEHPIYWWYGGEAKKKVADSFLQWLRKMIEAKGNTYWWSL